MNQSRDSFWFMSPNFFAGISDWQVGQSLARPAFCVAVRLLEALKSRSQAADVAGGLTNGLLVRQSLR
jgi:hypothetical protein